jgi:uncharacterized protein (DUF1015 family)
MARVYPFRAYLPVNKPEEVSSLPFDRYSPDLLESTLQRFSDSFLHVISPPGATQGNEKLHASRRQFEKMVENGVWERRDKALYLYRQKNEHSSHLGLIGCFSAQSVDSGEILGHEETLAAKEERLSAYLDVVAINAEPVNLCFKGGQDLREEWEAYAEQPALIEFTEPILGTHSIWEIRDTDIISHWQESLAANGPLFIADGHHRVASSVRLAKERNRGAEYGDAYFLGIAFPETEIDLLPFHRLVRGLTMEVLESFEKRFGQHALGEPPKPNECALRMHGAWYSLFPPEEALAVQWLSDSVLGPELGIVDLRSDSRIGFYGGITDPVDLAKKQDSEDWQLAFYLPAVSKSSFFECASNGVNMPPKSTWFEPKLLNGLMVLDLNNTL